VKEAHLKSHLNAWFQLPDILEKAKLNYGDNKKENQ
jgi:hypothetical protein